MLSKGPERLKRLERKTTKAAELLKRGKSLSRKGDTEANRSCSAVSENKSNPEIHFISVRSTEREEYSKAVEVRQGEAILLKRWLASFAVAAGC
jgi:hypothetical protein